ncbi:NAD(+) diphosphatase [Nocardia seriolae]|uniref:NAD(+) diphosphatase n=1 Tax=Nocardia seriolae TaxID=37332 RepID=A0ABC8AQ18_9NOCA|nr:NAD(+) diphosphatase [Nocardia seriolae]BEK85749.1 NAD(+) diphosphatase [Nocardia seriolae]BEK98426.1 NAD(+) diphosphatase [Nocardia seriolae]GEM26756.1 NADH pyrophosphatase [Nocardia seriolae NBRC 15557]
MLSRTSLDRAEHLRADEQALKEGWAQAKLLRMNRRGQVRVEGRAVVLEAAVTLAADPAPEAVFLGVEGGTHLWAVRDNGIEGELADLRAYGTTLDLDDFGTGLLATAIALLNWHDKAGFSAVDGSPTTSTNGGWSRTSTAGHEDFPRTDPAVICLIHDGGDRVLLARQNSWPEGLFSLLAGFVEAGESLERCVEREIKEEVGVDVREIRYLGSQPWPFPRSLMLGFTAQADPEQPLAFHDGEIVEAYWFTREEVKQALAAGAWGRKSDDELVASERKLLLPGSISIARTIVESWAADA